MVKITNLEKIKMTYNLECREVAYKKQAAKIGGYAIHTRKELKVSFGMEEFKGIV